MPILGRPTGKTLALWVTAALGLATPHDGFTPGATAQEAAAPYRNMPRIPPIGARFPKYLEVPDSAKGPPVEATKGYRIQTLGKDLYMVTENVYQAMFLVYENGVVVADIPPTLAAAIPKAIAEVTDKPITHLIYSHSHIDHIGGAGSLGGQPIVVAHEETKKTLARANDPRRRSRPLLSPTSTCSMSAATGLSFPITATGTLPATSSSMRRRKRRSWWSMSSFRAG